MIRNVLLADTLADGIKAKRADETLADYVVITNRVPHQVRGMQVGEVRATPWFAGASQLLTEYLLLAQSWRAQSWRTG